jgi:epoxyqueuosine reductase
VLFRSLRSKRRGYLRNVCVALGNSGLDEAIPSLAVILQQEPEELIRAHAAWALGQFHSPQSQTTLAQALRHEMAPLVKIEIEAALSFSS